MTNAWLQNQGRMNVILLNCHLWKASAYKLRAVSSIYFFTYFTWWSIHHHFWKPNISSNMGQMSPALPTYPFWLQALPPPTLNEVHTLRTWWWNITWSKYEVIREKQKGKKLGISLDREGNMPALLPPSSMQVGSYRASAVLPGGGAWGHCIPVSTLIPHWCTWYSRFKVAFV